MARPPKTASAAAVKLPKDSRGTVPNLPVPNLPNAGKARASHVHEVPDAVAPIVPSTPQLSSAASDSNQPVSNQCIKMEPEDRYADNSFRLVPEAESRRSWELSNESTQSMLQYPQMEPPAWSVSSCWPLSEESLKVYAEFDSTPHPSGHAPQHCINEDTRGCDDYADLGNVSGKEGFAALSQLLASSRRRCDLPNSAGCLAAPHSPHTLNARPGNDSTTARSYQLFGVPLLPTAACYQNAYDWEQAAQQDAPRLDEMQEGAEPLQYIGAEGSLSGRQWCGDSFARGPEEGHVAGQLWSEQACNHMQEQIDIQANTEAHGHMDRQQFECMDPQELPSIEPIDERGQPSIYAPIDRKPCLWMDSQGDANTWAHDVAYQTETQQHAEVPPDTQEAFMQ